MTIPPVDTNNDTLLSLLLSLSLFLITSIWKGWVFIHSPNSPSDSDPVATITATSRPDEQHENPVPEFSRRDSRSTGDVTGVAARTRYRGERRHGVVVTLSRGRDESSWGACWEMFVERAIGFIGRSIDRVESESIENDGWKNSRAGNCSNDQHLVNGCTERLIRVHRSRCYVVRACTWRSESASMTARRRIRRCE